MPLDLRQKVAVIGVGCTRCKSYGHPIGATGVRMIYELATQLRGQTGERQVQGARVGLAHNLGGPGAISCVSILGSDQ